MFVFLIVIRKSEDCIYGEYKQVASLEMGRLGSGPGDVRLWGRVTHICVSRLTIIGSDNGLALARHQDIIWTNAGIFSIGPFGTNFSEMLNVQANSFKNVVWKWRPFFSGPGKIVRYQTITQNKNKTLKHTFCDVLVFIATRFFTKFYDQICTRNYSSYSLTFYPCCCAGHSYLAMKWVFFKAWVIIINGSWSISYKLQFRFTWTTNVHSLDEPIFTTVYVPCYWLLTISKDVVFILSIYLLPCIINHIVVDMTSTVVIFPTKYPMY